MLNSKKTRNMDNNQLFTELSSEDSASIKGGFWQWAVRWAVRKAAWNSFKGWLAYESRTAPYRNANGRITTSYDPYDKPRLTIVSGVGQ
ncbi:MAG: hypothetical protein IGS23_02755 [Rivularia sp. T60_A2020_040]|nr:hypothetical protein [Rivularia sp. T60_A2020_040]